MKRGKSGRAFPWRASARSNYFPLFLGGVLRYEGILKDQFTRSGGLEMWGKLNWRAFSTDAKSPSTSEDEGTGDEERRWRERGIAGSWMNVFRTRGKGERSQMQNLA